MDARHNNATGVRRIALTAAERFWYVLMCVAAGAGYFAKIPAKKALCDFGLATMTGAERVWYVLMCVAFGYGYFMKIPVSKALSESGVGVIRPVADAESLASLPSSDAAGGKRVAVVLAAVAVVAAAVVGGAVAWNRHQQTSEPTITAAVPSMEADTDLWHLDGTYRLDVLNREVLAWDVAGKSEDTSSYQMPNSTRWIAYRTHVQSVRLHSRRSAA